MIETIRNITRDPDLFRVGNYLQQNKLTIDTIRDPESIHESWGLNLGVLLYLL